MRNKYSIIMNTSPFFDMFIMDLQIENMEESYYDLRKNGILTSKKNESKKFARFYLHCSGCFPEDVLLPEKDKKIFKEVERKNKEAKRKTSQLLLKKINFFLPKEFERKN